MNKIIKKEKRRFLFFGKGEYMKDHEGYIENART